MKLTEDRLNGVLKKSLDNIYVILADESILIEEKLRKKFMLKLNRKVLQEKLQKKNLDSVEDYSKDQNIIKNFNDPVKKDSHLRILYGNLAPEGAVAKISGKEGTLFKGKAKPYDSEEQAMKAIMEGR